MLTQPQFFAVFAGIIGVQHHRDVFGGVLGGDRFGITAGIEFAQVKLVRCGRLPQAQGVDRAILIAGDGNVIRDRQDIMRVHPDDALDAIQPCLGFGAPAKADTLGQFRAFDFPHMTVAQPMVGFFDLVAIFDVLAEHAIFIAQAVAHHRQLQGGATVDEASRQATQAAIAQAGIRLAVNQFLHVQAQIVQGFVQGVFQAEVEHRIAQGPAHQKLQG